MKYVIGKYPIEGSLLWCDAMEVYGTAHVCGNHWVAYAINLIDQTITVYDSMSKVHCWEAIKTEFKPISRYVPRLLKLAREFNKGFERFADFTEWPVVASKIPPPQQEGISNCGIMAVKFIECLACSFPMQKIDASKCSKMRLYYCAQLFNAGKALK